MTDDRMVDLETKYAHHEMTLDELQKTVYAQDLVIQKIEQNLKILKEKIDALLAGNAHAPVNEKPPHY